MSARGVGAAVVGCALGALLGTSGARAWGDNGAVPDVGPFVDAALLDTAGAPFALERAVRIDRRYLDITLLTWSGETELIFFTAERTRTWGHLEDTEHIVGTIELDMKRARHSFFVPYEQLGGYPQALVSVRERQAAVVLARPRQTTWDVDAPWPRYEPEAHLVDLQRRQCRPWVPSPEEPSPAVHVRWAGGRFPPDARTVRLPQELRVTDLAGGVVERVDWPASLYPSELDWSAVQTPEAITVAFAGHRRLLPIDFHEGLDGWPLGGRGVHPEYDDIWLIRFLRGGAREPPAFIQIGSGHYGVPLTPPAAQWCRHPLLSPTGRYVAYLAYRPVAHEGVHAEVQELRIWGPSGDVPVDFVCELRGPGVPRGPSGYGDLPMARTEEGIRAFADRDQARTEVGSGSVRNPKYVYAFSPDEKTLAFIRGEWLWLADLSGLDKEGEG